MTTYRVIRFYEDNRRWDSEIIAAGLTIEQAQAHCTDPETSSRTATSAEAVERTATRGPWFDGYSEE